MPSPLNEQLQASLGTAIILKRELGGGGMSRVFLAEETAFGRRVVVKVLAPELGATVSVERFKREVQLSAVLQHPHIVPVIAAGESGGLPYYTMPFIEGESLRDRLAREGALPISDTIAVLRDVAKALAYAHTHGVVHRDIKPANVLLTGDSAIVADFGIARALEASTTVKSGARLTESGTSIGTVGYMSPEQAAGDPDIDHRSDIYSFGCMAYEMLAGDPPFTGRSSHSILVAHVDEAPREIAQLGREVPPTLGQLIMQSLAKDPADRPQTAGEIIRMLDRAGSGSFSTIPPTAESPVRTSDPFKRALVVYVIAFVLVVFVARAAIAALGLPSWVLPGTIVVMALGLPVILFTAYSHSVARLIAGTARTAILGAEQKPGMLDGTRRILERLAARASRHLSWRRTVLGGTYALATFALVVAAYMGIRGQGVGAVGSETGAAAMQSGAWQSAAPMAHARAAHAVVSTGQAIYALGGTGTGRAPVRDVERFDGDKWSVVTTLPGQGLNAPAAAVVGSRIFVIGGFNTVTNVPSEKVLVYDLATRAWSEAASLPAPRGGHATVVLDGRIHVIGGGNSQRTLADHSEYDPSTNRWIERAPLPRSQGSPAAVAFNGKLYSIGGRSGPSDFGFVDVYDPRTDSWSAGPPIEPRGTSGAVLYCGTIYVFGGESQAKVASLADVLRLDPETNSWTAAPPMPTARNFARAVVMNDAVYVVGGSPTPGSSHASEGSSVVERFHIDCRR